MKRTFTETEYRVLRKRLFIALCYLFVAALLVAYVTWSKYTSRIRAELLMPRATDFQAQITMTIDQSTGLASSTDASSTDISAYLADITPGDDPIEMIKADHASLTDLDATETDIALKEMENARNHKVTIKVVNNGKKGEEGDTVTSGVDLNIIVRVDSGGRIPFSMILVEEKGGGEYHYYVGTPFYYGMDPVSAEDRNHYRPSNRYTFIDAGTDIETVQFSNTKAVRYGNQYYSPTPGTSVYTNLLTQPREAILSLPLSQEEGATYSLYVGWYTNPSRNQEYGELYESTDYRKEVDSLTVYVKVIGADPEPEEEDSIPAVYGTVTETDLRTIKVKASGTDMGTESATYEPLKLELPGKTEDYDTLIEYKGSGEDLILEKQP